MTAPAQNSAIGSAIDRAASTRPVPSGRGFPNINPVTGLSTDYLNHFAEAVMALEMADHMPECLDDLRDWQPRTYAEHFATSRFSNRDVVVRAYHAADPAVRAALDAAAETLNATLAATRDAAIRMANTDALARYSLSVVRPLIARIAALINGTAEAAGQASAQAEIDAMFGR